MGYPRRHFFAYIMPKFKKALYLIPILSIAIAFMLLLTTGAVYPSINTLREHVGQADGDDTYPRIEEAMGIISNKDNGGGHCC